MIAARRVVAVLVAVLSAAACGGAPSAFVGDQRVLITAPAPMSLVSAPFTVTWSGRRSGDAAYAVFVDRVPIAPGHTVRDLATDQCKHQSGCPDPSYLAGRGVYVTAAHTIEIPTLPIAGGTARRAAHPAHTVTLVALDAAGRRRGDVAWVLEIRG